MKIAGVVLAGGQSSRYGQPKMFELFDGHSLYKHSLIALQKNKLEPLVIATNANLLQRFAEEEVQMIVEQQPHQGPLFALHNIMTALPDVEWFFVVASDMPYMNAEFIRSMLAYVDDRFDAIVPKQAIRIHPLAALYRRSAIPNLKQLTEQNKRSMKALLEQLRVCYVSFEENNSTFTNINSQQDWSKTTKKEYEHE